MDPVISIIVPCYNQAEFLDDALNSVLDQNFENWECIIVNDGSPDETKEVTRKWLDLDPRFRYIAQPNRGVSAARNFGISHARGNYILPLDADDKLGFDYIKNVLFEFNKNSKLKLVYCQAEKFGKEKKQWKLPKFDLQQLAFSNMIFCSAIFRKSDWRKVGGYDVLMKEGFEDWEFWISLLKDGGEVKQLDYVAFFYRIQEVSRTKKIDKSTQDALLDYMSVKHADFFVKQYGSFFFLKNENAMLENRHNENLKSEKYVIDLFCYRFFRFTLFGHYRP